MRDETIVFAKNKCVVQKILWLVAFWWLSHEQETKFGRSLILATFDLQQNELLIISN